VNKQIKSAVLILPSVICVVEVELFDRSIHAEDYGSFRPKKGFASWHACIGWAGQGYGIVEITIM
jgi:hypothetical protein